MINWNEIREEYIRGGITQGALADKYGIPAGSLRRRAAAEGWRTARKALECGTQEAPAAVSTRVARQLAVTDRLLEIIAKALEDDDELYRHVEFGKNSEGYDFVCRRLDAIDEERTGRLVRLLSELFEQQRIILGIHDYRDELTAAKLEQDERLTMSKLSQQSALAERQNSIAERKLELELYKIDGGSGEPDPSADGFLAALGISEDVTLYEQP